MVNTEMLAGVARIQSLRNFSLRTSVDDVRALVAVMIQSDRFGTSIVAALRSHSDSLRIRRRQRAEETARKTPVKLVFPLVFCIFPELLVVILTPGMFSLFRALAKMAEHFSSVPVETLDIATLEEDFGGDLMGFPIPEEILNGFPRGG